MKTATMEKLTRNNIVLLGCLLVLIIFLPFLTSNRSLFLHFLLSAIIVSGVYSCAFQKRTRRILATIGAITLVVTWLDIIFGQSDVFKIVAFAAIFAFICAIVFFLVRHIARSKNVTSTIIISAINGYLLMGLLGALLLDIADTAGGSLTAGSGSPGIKFAGSAVPVFHDYMYFSFVTLTTLGYGDITPASAATKSVALMIAVAGQLYLTILIAMLVGKYLSQKNR